MRETLPILRQRRGRRLARLRKQESRSLKGVLGIGLSLSLLLSGLILAAAFAYAGLTRDLPPVEELPRLLNPPDGLLLRPTRLYDRSGTHLLKTFGVDDSPRRYAPLDASAPQHIPPALSQDVVALIDPQFWKHPGYTLEGWQDPGLHPTLAQKLVSDLLLYDEKPSLRRALRERLLAAQVTRRFGRDQVLEWYLNSADFGRYAFGVQAAAELYFGRPASELSPAECALLTAVIQSPGQNPLDAPQAAIQRAHEVIADLQEQGQISEEAALEMQNVPLHFQPVPALRETPAEAFLNLALAQAQTRFSRERIERGGLTIYTTLDSDLQQQVECLIVLFARRMAGEPDPEEQCRDARYLAALPPGALVPDGSASAIVLDPVTGQVLAAAGETLNGQETALLAAHQPGSMLTPFIYLTGFTRGMGPASLVWDIPGAADVENFDGRYHGPVRLRSALANDYPVPAEAVRQQMGAENVDRIAASFGLDADGPLHLLELGGAYGAFGTQGVYYGQEIGTAFGPAAILRMEAVDGGYWMDWSAPQARAIVTPGLAYLVTNVLSDEPARWPSLGNPNVLEIGRPAGVKLGRTADGMDTWAVGYSPRRSVAVWVGTRSGGPLSTRLAGTLWSALMQSASEDLPRDGWMIPQGVSVKDVCDPSGLLPTEDCPNIVSEVFLQGNEPTHMDTLFRSYEVNRETGALATVFTPEQFVEKRVYMIVPPEARAWALGVGVPSPPVSYDAIQPPRVNPDVKISAPALFAEVGGVVQIVGSAAGEGFDHYRIQVGKGLNPQAWIQVGEDRSTPVVDGVLIEWDTRGLDGLYAVQLVVVHADQRVETAVTQVTVISP